MKHLEDKKLGGEGSDILPLTVLAYIVVTSHMWLFKLIKMENEKFTSSVVVHFKCLRVTCD